MILRLLLIGLGITIGIILPIALFVWYKVQQAHRSY